MNPQPARLCFSLGILLFSSIFAFYGCTGESLAPADSNSTGAESNQSVSAVPYPLDFCLVSGNDFADHPEMIPYIHVHEGISIKLCCKPCLPKFEKNPQQYLTHMQEEIEEMANGPQG